MSKKKILAALAALPLVAALAACSGQAASDDAEKGSADNPVKIGVIGASDPEWDIYKKAAADEGISVDIIDFSDYAQPNPALSEGDIDINQFQHIIYLAQYNEASNDDLTPIGATAIYPLGLYSTKYDSVADIPKGSEVAVPNDESNQARGLLVLQSAGLITLKDGGSVFSTVSDVDEAKSKVKVTALEASLTPTSLPDLAAAIINNDFIEDAGLKASDALAQDDPNDPNAVPYINIFVTRAADKDNEVYNKLVDIYQSNQDVLDAVQEKSGGTAVFVKTPAADLQSSLDDVVADIKAKG
ncbi:D-methionine transport system substrate-binding protein [Paramicrobacterium humi]|uniref:Lipoprotein n=1 Tax=Paramicrobacterium humi TaxID=640635 RepID=A0A1H4IQV0_9MICO|nr:MetQ/NlpA family ABC transporter substrate-binding protein [Microbacterium humi]SEB36046.1 D-methionine transport system substrate-binding protein [Microbacterium humi]